MTTAKKTGCLPSCSSSLCSVDARCLSDAISMRTLDLRSHSAIGPRKVTMLSNDSHLLPALNVSAREDYNKAYTVCTLKKDTSKPIKFLILILSWIFKHLVKQWMYLCSCTLVECNFDSVAMEHLQASKQQWV